LAPKLRIAADVPRFYGPTLRDESRVTSNVPDVDGAAGRPENGIRVNVTSGDVACHRDQIQMHGPWDSDFPRYGSLVLVGRITCELDDIFAAGFLDLNSIVVDLYVGGVLARGVDVKICYDLWGSAP
jgi:hypothetical protein